MQNKRLFDVSAYSEDLQTVMHTTPGWVTRWGTGTILVILLLMVGASFIIKYPDTISANFELNSLNPAAKIYTKDFGRVELLVKENDSVRAGQTLGYLWNTARFEDILYFDSIRTSLAANIYNGRFDHIEMEKEVNLGELQDAYSNLFSLISEFKRYNQKNLVNNYLSSISTQENLYNQISGNLSVQREFINSQKNLSYKGFKRDSILFSEKVISERELELSENAKIPYDLTLMSNAYSEKQNELNRINILNRKMDILYEDNKYVSDLSGKILAAFNDLQQRYAAWKQKYLFITPIAGRVTLLGIWQSNQTVTNNQEIMNVASSNEQPMGLIRLDVGRSGKVQTGQKVLINMSNYPANEYGYIAGEIFSISKLPQNGNFYVMVRLVNGLSTDMHKQIEFKEQMTGSASIITKDLRLFDRIIYKLREVFERTEKKAE